MLLLAPDLCLAQTIGKMESLNAQQIAGLLKQEGFAPDKIPLMTAIAMAESSGKTKAFNPRGLDKSYGLFQVNMHGNLGPARMKEFGLQSEQQLFDPKTNVRAAKRILESQGLGAWSVYKGGQYKKFLPEAQKATQALGTQQPTQQQQTPGFPGVNIYVVGDQDRQAQKSPEDFLKQFAFGLSTTTGTTPQSRASSFVNQLLGATQAPKYFE